MISLRTTLTGVVLSASIALLAPSFVDAQANTQEEQNYCTYCWWNPVNGQLYCANGGAIGDTDCWCWVGGCGMA
jgi:hypothetical protein